MIFLWFVCLLLLYLRVFDNNQDKEVEVESLVETEGGEEEDGTAS